MISILLIIATIVLLNSYLTAISSKDLIRLLISLELMFGAVFLVLIPLFSIENLINSALGIAIIIIFTSSSELLVLIAAITLADKKFKSISIDTISSGGDTL
ncbi:MAG: NADH-quinone oxidoreductase subunit K [Methanosarcinales archaeon]